MNGLIFDSHAHYDDEKFDSVRIETIRTMFDSGNVGMIVNVGTNPTTNANSIALAEKFQNVYAACGYHPHDILEIDDEEKAISDLRQKLSHQKCVAIGEIGLDYHYDAEYSELQKKWFRLQMKLASELNMPVIVHDREAHGDCFDIICENPGVTGVFHSFSGSAEFARDLVRKGWYISFSGSVTFKNAVKLTEAVKAVPLDRMLVETDCPYLAPVPVRGTVNNSENIKYTAAKIAEIKSIPIEDVYNISYENAMNFFGI